MNIPTYALAEVRLQALESAVRELLEIDDDILLRLQTPTGWTPKQISDHQKDLQDRAAVKARLYSMVMQPSNPDKLSHE